MSTYIFMFGNDSEKRLTMEETLDLTDIRVSKQQYEGNFRRLKFFGMQYIPDEDVVSDLIPGCVAQDLGKAGGVSQSACFSPLLVAGALSLHSQLSEACPHRK